jgi:hypothetical protein
MQATKDPYSPEELEYRFQELRAQRARAKMLFYCYAQAADELDADLDADDDDADDAYSDYYAEDAPP